jgi:hypothetical protein
MLIISCNAFTVELVQIPLDINNKSILGNFSLHQGALFSGGDHVGNGGGLAESYLAFSKVGLKSFIRSCLSSSICLSTNKEIKLAKDVLNHSKIEETPIKYVIGKETPGFFFLDGNVRVAKTSYVAGDAIYVNRDLLYDRQGRAISLPTAITILFHELGHQVGYKDHDFLDLVGSKIGLFVSHETTLISFLHMEKDSQIGRNKVLKLKTIAHERAKEMLTLESSNKTIPLSPLIESTIKESVQKACPLTNPVCANFLGFQDNYNIDVVYYSKAQFEQVNDPHDDKYTYSVRLSLFVNTHHDRKRRVSSFYDLKQRVHFLLKMNRLDDTLISTYLLKVDPTNFFGLSI